MIINRDLQQELLKAAQETPVVALLGPRQSGKTTLAQMAFPNHTDANLEHLDTRTRAIADPEMFITTLPSTSGIIIDEIQHVPELFFYVQVHADKLKKDGYFVLTGSQNFTLHKGITQSLAGRISLLTLLPLSIHDLERANSLPDSIDDFLFKGSYPKVYVRADVSIRRLYSNYVQSYLQRDVRDIAKIKNLVMFHKFLRACAARTGQLLNLSSIGDDLGISHNTVREWISILVASYVVFLLEPYNKKISKRLVKTPKLFFYDTGLACALLDLKKPQRSCHKLPARLLI